MLELCLLGTFQVTVDGEPVPGFATDKARALLAYLAVESERPHRRDTLATLLWPEQPDEKARHSLRQALSNLRQVLNDLDDESGFLQVTRESVQFNANSRRGVRLDVAIFADHDEATRRHSHRGLGACLPCLRRLEEITALYQGDFLKGFYLEDSSEFEEWVLLKREWYHLHVVEALTVLGHYYERRGEPARAREYFRRQVHLEPWREEAHRQLMVLLAAEGQRSAALRQYQSCRTALAGELGVEPTPETVALFESIRDTSASLPRALSPAPRLPSPPASFVGRDRELAALNGMLSDPHCRLVTLTGPGGIGKSSLALATAQAQVGLFAHGLVYVPLATVTSTATLVPALVDALGFTPGLQDLKSQLVDYVRSKSLLVVCDNFEHILEGADLLSEILRAAPGVVMLVTSRERLNLRDEWVYPVAGLSYDNAPVAFDAASPTSPDEALSMLPEALTLFVRLASQAGSSRDAWPGMAPEDLPAVAQICRMLDGVPLAIELAAALAPHRTCRDIAAEIAQNLDVLTTRLRDLPERHRSIRATFEHSWQLLTDTEQQVFGRLSLFRGGFDLEAAKTVAQASEPVLQGLLGKSLLRRVVPAHCASDIRYDIHPLLQQYAGEKLAEVPQAYAQLAQNHSIYYATFLERLAPQLQGAGQKQVLRAITADIGNVRCAWEWACARLENRESVDLATEVAERALPGLYLFFVTSNWFQEGMAQFRRMAAAIEPLAGSPALRLLFGRILARQAKCGEFVCDTEETQTLFVRSLAIFQELGAHRAMALPLHGLGYIAHMRGEYDLANRYLLEGLAAFRQADEVGGVAGALNLLCLVARREGRYAEARQFCEEALALRRSMSDRRGMAASLNSLGLVLCALGAYSEAQAAFEEGLRICRDLGYLVGMGNTLTGLCQTAFRLNDFAAAERYAYEGLQVYIDIGDRWGIAIAYNNLGYIAMETAEYARAKDFYCAGIATFREAGIKAGLANTLNNLGQSCYKLGELPLARQYLLEALPIAQDTGETPIILEILAWLAVLWAGEGEKAPALEILAFVRQHPAVLQSTSEMAGAAFAELSAGLPAMRVGQLEAQGQAQTLERATTRLLAALGA
ncbi:MAG: tetratricopeptide repeat protein [Anaerolineae bacterium]|nr:tetratricopeptide repeat protein [Anaerolineae bacterium]